MKLNHLWFWLNIINMARWIRGKENGINLDRCFFRVQFSHFCFTYFCFFFSLISVKFKRETTSAFMRIYLIFVRKNFIWRGISFFTFFDNICYCKLYFKYTIFNLLFYAKSKLLEATCFDVLYDSIVSFMVRLKRMKKKNDLLVMSRTVLIAKRNYFF